LVTNHSALRRLQPQFRVRASLIQPIHGTVLARGVRLTPIQEQTLRLAAARGEVRRRDVASVCGISPELARRALLGLEQSGILGRTGRARGTRYVLRYQGG
jgi:hypothetical protein